ncbi:DUF1648 domain-containing protein [Paraclostridium tenue]|uniref:DUF1648 domain-containing protein n=1 Tax=Paraclostridium tenue TaxID=1737 RepID=A0ABN1M950_9FIRM
MKKINWKILISTSIICILPILLGIVFYKFIPNQVAIHFDISNNPNSYMNKNIVLFGFPIIISLMQIICCILNDLNKSQDIKIPKVEYVYKSILPIISVVAYITTLSIALGTQLDVRRIVCFLVGFIFILIGNYIPKTSSTYTHGIHPYSFIKNEQLYKKFNRLMGYSFVILGVLLIISIFFDSKYSAYAVLITIAITIIESLYFIKLSKSCTKQI